MSHCPAKIEIAVNFVYASIYFTQMTYMLSNFAKWLSFELSKEKNIINTIRLPTHHETVCNIVSLMKTNNYISKDVHTCCITKDKCWFYCSNNKTKLYEQCKVCKKCSLCCRCASSLFHILYNSLNTLHTISFSVPTILRRHICTCCNQHNCKCTHATIMTRQFTHDVECPNNCTKRCRICNLCLCSCLCDLHLLDNIKYNRYFCHKRASKNNKQANAIFTIYFVVSAVCSSLDIDFEILPFFSND